MCITFQGLCVTSFQIIMMNTQCTYDLHTILQVFFPEVVYFLQYLFYKISTKIKIAKYSDDYPIYPFYCIKSM